MNSMRNSITGMRPDPKREIISIGTINVDQLLGPIDHWPDRGTETVYPQYEMRVGGGGGIFGAALMALGANQRMVVNIGRDEILGTVNRTVDMAFCCEVNDAAGLMGFKYALGSAAVANVDLFKAVVFIREGR